jgi:hypothetical protein
MRPYTRSFYEAVAAPSTHFQLVLGKFNPKGKNNIRPRLRMGITACFYGVSNLALCLS